MSYKSNRCIGFTTRPLLVTYWPFGLGTVSGGYTEGMGPGTSSTLPLRISRSWIRGMKRTNLPDAVLTSTVLTTPLRPGNSCVITPSGHLNRGCWSSCTRTTEHYGLCPVDSCVNLLSALDSRNGVMSMRTSPHLRALLINNNPCGQQFS